MPPVNVNTAIPEPSATLRTLRQRLEPNVREKPARRGDVVGRWPSMSEHARQEHVLERAESRQQMVKLKDESKRRAS
jgi:hypothetical protein